MTTTNPVYMIVQLQVTDLDAFLADYATPLVAHHDKYGVEIVVATPRVEVLEGDYDANFTVVLKFESAETQRAWYEDADYRPLKAIREHVTDLDHSTAIIAPAFQPAIA